MERLFILAPTFDKTWRAMGLGDEELRQLQHFLLSDPDVGDVIPGLSGARKVRIPLTGRGKSGGGRVIYVDIVVKKHIHLVLAYPKNIQENLTPEQKQLVRKIVEAIKKE